MKVIILTVFVSLLLVGMFVALFIYLSDNGDSDFTRDSLLPLDDDDAPLPKPPEKPSPPA